MPSATSSMRQSQRLSREGREWSRKFDWGEEFDVIKRYQDALLYKLEREGWEQTAQSGPSGKESWKILAPDDERTKKGGRSVFTTLTPIIQYCWASPKWRPAVEDVLDVARRVDSRAVPGQDCNKSAITMLKYRQNKPRKIVSPPPELAAPIELPPVTRKRRANDSLSMVAHILAGMASSSPRNAVVIETAEAEGKGALPPHKVARAQEGEDNQPAHGNSNDMVQQYPPSSAPSPPGSEPPSHIIVICPGAPGGARYVHMAPGPDSAAHEEAKPAGPPTDFLVSFLKGQGGVEGVLAEEITSLLSCEGTAAPDEDQKERVGWMCQRVQRLVDGLQLKQENGASEGAAGGADLRSHHEAAIQSQTMLETLLSEDRTLVAATGKATKADGAYLAAMQAALDAAKARTSELGARAAAAGHAALGPHAAARVKQQWQAVKQALEQQMLV